MTWTSVHATEYVTEARLLRDGQELQAGLDAKSLGLATVAHLGISLSDKLLTWVRTGG